MKVFVTLFAVFSCLAFVNNPDDEFEKSRIRGEKVYQEYCIVCHGKEGAGIEGVFPPLANSDYLAKYPEKAIRGIKYGQSGEIVVNGISYNNVMPELGLDDEEIADVMNYINNAWGNKNEVMVTEERVEAIEKE